MMKAIRQTFLIAGMLSSFFFASSSFGYEITSKYTTIVYTDESQLSEFNKKALKDVSYHEGNASLPDEVKGKLDVLIDKVVTILLQSPPAGLNVRIRLANSFGDIQSIYRERYGKDGGYIAFYSPADDTIFLSVSNLRQGVLAHELAHAVIYHYYGRDMSGRIQELIAQFVETHIGDN